MWTCPKCKRRFQTLNQFHMCVVKDIGELFLDRSDELVLAYDAIEQAVMAWQPHSHGASTHSVVFTNKKAWLIIKPLQKELDVKFYHGDVLPSDRIKKCSFYRNKYAYHLRVSSELEVDREFIDLLRQGYDYAMQ